MGTADRVQPLTLEAYSRLYEQEGPFEIIDGQRKPLMPPVVIHGLILRALFRLVDAYCTLHQPGEVVTEMPFVLMYNSNWVKGSRVPDIMFFAAERWQRYIKETQYWQSKPFVLVPDLAVEIVSPNDLYTEIQDKVDRYLNDAVRLIWVVNPRRNRVTIYEADHFKTLTQNNTLTGGEIIPDLNIALAELFAISKE
jgi:Uma2 family endonuclease